MRRTLALIGLLASALAGGVALSGCGAGGLDTSAVAQAAQTTQNDGTAQVAFTADAPARRCAAPGSST